MVSQSTARQRSLGARLLAYRRSHGLSRRVVAGLIGRSEEWLRLVETGASKLDSIEAAVALCRVLHVEHVADLLSLEESPGSRKDRRRVPLVNGLRKALLDYPNLDAYGAFHTVDPESSDVDQLWRIWRLGPARYSRTVGAAPSMITALRTAYSVQDRPAVAGKLISAYHLARSVLGAFGERKLARIAADRAMAIAANLDDPSWTVCAARNLAIAHLGMGELDDTQAVAAAAIKKLPDSIHHHLLGGSLHLVAAKAAARGHHPQLAELRLAKAWKAAEQLPEDAEHFNIWFGPTDVAVTEVHLAIAGGSLDKAIRLGGKVILSDRYPRSLQAGHYLNLATAYAHRGQDAAAVFALRQAEDICHEEIRYSAQAATTLGLLEQRGHAATRNEISRLSRLVA